MWCRVFGHRLGFTAYTCRRRGIVFRCHTCGGYYCAEEA